MTDSTILTKIISEERIAPYLRHHNNDIEKAIEHYKGNILISESFYPLLSIIEIGMRNSIDYQLTRLFNERNWFDSKAFNKIASRYQIDRIAEAKANILSEKKDLTAGRVISELSFGFWTSLFDTRFEMSLWKSLRLAFPNCPKAIRKRKTLSSKFNSIRKLRNRIFHHEAITWNLDVIDSYKNEILEGIDWLDKDLIDWISDLNRIEEQVDNFRSIIEER